MDQQETPSGPVRVIGFDRSYGIVYAELADGSFMSADFIDPILRTGSIKISDAPMQAVEPEYIVKEMVGSGDWQEVDEVFDTWSEAIRHLQKDWQYSATTVRRGRRHSMETGKPICLNVSSGPIRGSLEESTGEVTFPQGSMSSNAIQMMSPLDISRSILIIEEEEPSLSIP